MNREAVQKWADELMFGDRKQITDGYLWNKVENEQAAFCALGVACAVYAEEHTKSLSEVLDGTYISTTDFLPTAAQQWIDLPFRFARQIVTMNDNERKSFPEIGAWVRDNLLKEE